MNVRGPFLLSAFLGLAAITAASPKLRLQSSAIGPVYIPTGQDGVTQSVPVTNIGDGALHLSVTGNAPWMAPCIEDESQLLVNVMLFTSKLGPGTYTGLVTVTDPQAIDAPQTITVTVVIGSGSVIPLSMDLYVAPGGSATSSVNVACVSTSIANPSGGPQIMIATGDYVVGSYGSLLPCTNNFQVVTASAPAGTGAGEYDGSIAFSGSSYAPDNHAVAVRVHVTAAPVAVLLQDTVFFRMAAGDPAVSKLVGFSAPGVLVSSARSDVDWLGVGIPSGRLGAASAVIITAKPAGLAAGDYPATVTVQSNAANSPSVIHVVLTVLAAGPPVIYYNGVVDDAVFSSDAVAPGELVALFGEQLTGGQVFPVPALPWASVLGGVRVFVNDVAAPVFYASPTQINFAIPYATAAGDAVVRVVRDGQQGNSISLKVASVSPKLIPGLPGGSTLVLYGVGFGQTTPAAIDGQGAVGLMRVDGVEVFVGESEVGCFCTRGSCRGTRGCIRRQCAAAARCA